MKDFLKKLIAKRTARISEIRSLIAASQDVNEVRSLTAEAEKLQEEVTEAQTKLNEIEAEEQRAAQTATEPETRANIPANAQLVNGNVVGAFTQNNAATQTRENDDPFATMEYRKAFMHYAQTGEPIPARLYQRDGMPTNTDSIGATIPTTTLNEFINEVRLVYGQLFNRVRHLNIQGAVKVPIARLQASFKWITETTVAPREDGGTINEFVMFEYNMAEIRVSQTLLSQIVSLDLFEREIVKVMVTAYLQAMDLGIVRGTGQGQMLGILNDPRVTGQAGHIIQMTAADMNNWTAWRKKFFAKLPLGYRAGEFIFPLGTVDEYLETMADSNNNPIFRQATGLEVNDGDSRNPNGRFFGRNISLVEPDVIPDFDSAADGDIVGIFWQPEEYAINTNMQFGMRRWFDEDRNEWVNKMLTVVDGKVLNPRGIYLIQKKA
jgi:HK97 family phage major capsid protein